MKNHIQPIDTTLIFKSFISSIVQSTSIITLLIATCLSATAQHTESEQELSLSGPVVQGGMLVGHTSPGAQVSLDGEVIPLDDHGYFALGFGRDANKAQLLIVRTSKGSTIERVLKPTSRAYAIERVNGLPQATVTPPASVSQRISREAGLVATARLRRDMRNAWRQTFVLPAEGRISGVYGSQRVLNGEPKRPHYGLDIAAPEGTSISAPAPGIVTLAEADLYYSGGTVIIDHGQGVSSTFLHMSSVDVEVGQVLQQGEHVGAIGSTGRASGPHLDWRMNWRNQRIDPMLLIDPDSWQPSS